MVFVVIDLFCINRFALSVFLLCVRAAKHLQDRADLYPSFGKLYAYGVASVEPGRREHDWDLVNVQNFDELKRCLRANHPNWRGALDNDIDWTATCFSREVMLCEIAFEGKFSLLFFTGYALVDVCEGQD